MLLMLKILDSLIRAYFAETKKCANNTFDCHNNGEKCIDYSKVCDGRNDCGNYEDEHNTKDKSPCPGIYEIACLL